MASINFIKKYYVRTASVLLAFLFIYAAISKILDFESFQVQLAQSPLLSAYAGSISYLILIIELIVAMMLLFPVSNKVGLYSSTGLMAAFTIYIYLILNYSDFIPCSCGGILEKLGWTEHLVFNICFYILAVSAIYVKAYRSGKKRRDIELLLSILVTIISCGIVLILFQSSEYIIKKENNFTRRFLLHPVIQDRKLDLGLNSYYIAGVDKSRIYLGNKTAPLLISTVDLDLKKISARKVSLDHSDYPFRNLKLDVKPPHFYLFDGTVPIIYRGRLGDSLAKTISFKDAYFSQLAILDSMRFAIRVQKSADNGYAIASLDLHRDPKLIINPAVLQKQIDGVFDVDGVLNSTGDSRKLVYTYAYRNQFIVLDSGLNVLHRLNTIDTTVRAKIAVRMLNNGSSKMSAPPLSVNRGSVISGDLLFNESNLKGKHEPSGIWKSSTVVDVYRTDQQKYIGSFSIEHSNGLGVSDMIATDEYLFVLIGNDMIRYKIRDNVFR